MVGGYKLIDFKSKNITLEGVKIEGIREAIKKSRKMLICTNLIVTDLAIPPVQISFTEHEGILKGTIMVSGADVTLSITTDDIVTLVSH